jgi:uncharacterized protein
MTVDTQPVTELSADESWQLISAMSLGRLVTVVAGRPELFPVNFVVQRSTVLFRTSEGTKLFSAVAEAAVRPDHAIGDQWASLPVRSRAGRRFRGRLGPRS